MSPGLLLRMQAQVTGSVALEMGMVSRLHPPFFLLRNKALQEVVRNFLAPKKLARKHTFRVADISLLIVLEL